MTLFNRSRLISLEPISRFSRASLRLTEEEEQPTEEPRDPAEEEPAEEPADYSDEEPEETPSPEAEEDLLVEIKKVSQTSPEFDEKVKAGLGNITKDIRQLLSESGYSVVTSALLTDIVASSTQSMVPWSMLSSAALFEEHQVAVSESVSDGNGGSAESLNPEGLLRVEVGHVINSLAPQYINSDKGLFSDLDGFKYAHTSDIARLAADKKQKLAFYIGDSDASRSECFAECFAALNGGGAVYTMEVMSKYFPAVLKQIKDIMNSVKSGSKMSGEQEPGEQ